MGFYCPTDKRSVTNNPGSQSVGVVSFLFFFFFSASDPSSLLIQTDLFVMRLSEEARPLFALPRVVFAALCWRLTTRVGLPLCRRHSRFKAETVILRSWRVLKSHSWVFVSLFLFTFRYHKHGHSSRKLFVSTGSG